MFRRASVKDAVMAANRPKRTSRIWGDVAMDYATTDLVLAIVHHLLVFVLAGILAFEIGTVRLTMKRDEILRVGRVDIWYGILAGVIIVVGFTRATVAAKGWAYYSVNVF